MIFEWDEGKADANLHKHGVSFAEASTVFFDPTAVIFDDIWHSEQESWEILIGYSEQNRLLLVSFTEREYEVIRIISSRKTTRAESKRHEEEREE